MGEAQQRVIVLALALCSCVDGDGAELAPDAGRSMMADAGAHDGGDASRPGGHTPAGGDAGAVDMMPDGAARKGEDAGLLEEAGADLEDAGADDQADAGADAGCHRNTGQICAPSERRCGKCDGTSWLQLRSLVVCSGECVLGECAPHVDGWGDFNGECYE